MYSKEGVERLLTEYPRVDQELERVTLGTLQACADTTSERAKEFLQKGVARRLRLLRRSLSNVFTLFPPAATTPIESDDLDDAVISLHAFVINTYGLFDNLAWAFVVRHGLEQVIGRHTRIGFFLDHTKRHMPAALRSYVDSPKMIEWHTRYLKNYRDALAHKSQCHS